MKAMFGNWFKTQKEAEYERKEYYKWAYPFSDIQKEKIEEILKELITDEDKTSYIFNYLIVKQECDKYEFDKYLNESDIKIIAKDAYGQMYQNEGLNTHKYIALAEADLKIKKGLRYPSIKTLINRSLQIKKIID